MNRLVHRRLNGDSGFSLIESLVAMMILAVVGAGVLSVLIGADAAVDSAKSTTDVNEEARLAINRISRELRQAREIRSVVGNDGAHGLTFGVDFNGNHVVEDNTPDPEVLKYEYDVANKRITLSAANVLGNIETLPILAGNVTSFSIQYRSSRYSYDCAPADGITTWQELDGATTPVCAPASAAVGNQNGKLDAPELKYIDSISISFTVFEGDRRQVYRTQVDMRNQA